TNGTLRFVYNQQQLDDTLHDMIMEEPGQSAADATRDMLDASVHRLDQVADDLDSKNYDAGADHLRQARDEFERAKLPFEVLGKRQTDERYQRIFVAAQKQRDIQNRLLAAGEAMLSSARSADADSLRASRETYKKLIAEYNAGSDEFAKVLAQLRSSPAPAK